jgi:putative oxidoreductase
MMKLGRFLARSTIGALFIGHGTQKLFGWFGGGGPEGTAQGFDSLGLKPARRYAFAAGAAETGGGALLAVGLATPLAAASLSGVMLTAIHKVHWKNGPWVANGGFEYNAVVLAALLALVEIGPGPWSLDAKLGIEKRGTAWALAALGTGAAGAALAIRLSKTIDSGAADEPTTAEAALQQQREAEQAESEQAESTR